MRARVINLKILVALLAMLVGVMSWRASLAGISKTGSDDLCNLCHGGGNITDVTTRVEATNATAMSSCLGCHSSEGSEPIKMLGDSIVPVVFNMTPPENPLASGNFYWVAQGDDTKGHNVFANNPDNNWSMAPGAWTGIECGTNSCHKNLDKEASAGANRSGCLSCHMVSDSWSSMGYHHADDSNIVVGGEEYDTDGYYRFLSGHNTGEGHGVCGIEDPDWQATSSDTDHNEYLGYSGTKTSVGSFSALGHTMTGFCCGCHGNYHVEQDASGAWIRHASDAPLCPDGVDGCECATQTTYNPQAPVARPSLSSWTGPSDTVTPDTDLAMCLSCHVAHGSPYPKMLRWDLSGCLNCHTGK